MILTIHADEEVSELRRETAGFRVGAPREVLNASCGECQQKLYGKGRREVDRFRDKHTRAHALPECVTVWVPYSENPLTADDERFLRRWLPQARSGYTLGWQGARHFSTPGVLHSRWTRGQ